MPYPSLCPYNHPLTFVGEVLTWRTREIILQCCTLAVKTAWLSLHGILSGNLLSRSVPNNLLWHVLAEVSEHLVNRFRDRLSQTSPEITNKYTIFGYRFQSWGFLKLEADLSHLSPSIQERTSQIPGALFRLISQRDILQGNQHNVR